MSSEKLPRLQVNRQQEHILLLALFMLKHKVKKDSPPKKQVLGFIRIRGLIQVREWSNERLSNGDLAWENDIAWRRQDLKDNYYLRMPETGLWQITKLGEDRLLRWATLVHYYLEAHESLEGRLDAIGCFFGEEKVVITDETIMLADEAYEIAASTFPERIPQLTEEEKGKIRL